MKLIKTAETVALVTPTKKIKTKTWFLFGRKVYTQTKEKK